MAQFCVVCGAGFASHEYLAAHFQRRHPNQLRLLHSGPLVADRPADHLAPTIDPYTTSDAATGMHRGTFGAGAEMRAAPCVGADYPMNEPMHGYRYAERGWADLSADGHGAFGERSRFGDPTYGDLRVGYSGGGGGDRGGILGEYNPYAASGSRAAPRPLAHEQAAYKKRQREETDARIPAQSRRRVDSKLTGIARWNEGKVLMHMCIDADTGIHMQRVHEYGRCLQSSHRCARLAQ